MFWSKKKVKENNLFISIGAGINQLPLIKELKEMNYHVIGVDNNICAPGMYFCDIKIQESIDNYTEIYKKIKELLLDGDITGILTKSFGPAIKTISYISNELKIPLLPFKRIDDLINKQKMKQVLVENNVLTPDYVLFSKKAKSRVTPDFRFPSVIKPVIGHAKNQVQYINNKTSLNEYLKTIPSGSHDFLIEDFVSGDEVIAIGIVHKGSFYLIELTDKIKSPLPYFVDLMHISPSKYNNLWEKIQTIGQRITDSFEIYTSPLLMELVITKNEEIFLIETAPEFGGEFLPDILVPERSNYNIIRETIKAVADNNFIPPGRKKNNNAVVVRYITSKKGALLSFNSQVQNANGILFSKIFKDIGSATQKPKSNHDRIGVLVAKGKTIDEALSIAEKAESDLNIRIGK